MSITGGETLPLRVIACVRNRKIHKLLFNIAKINRKNKKVTLFVTWCDIGKYLIPLVLHCVYSRFFKVTRICPNYKVGMILCPFYSSNPLIWNRYSVKYLPYPFWQDIRTYPINHIFGGFIVLAMYNISKIRTGRPRSYEEELY